MGLPSVIQIGVIDSSIESLETTIPLFEMIKEDIDVFCLNTGRDVSFDFLHATANGDSDNALEEVQAFLSMGIQLIVGPTWSSHVQACLSYANDNNILLFSGTSSSPLLSITNDNLFRLAPTDFVQAPVLVTMLESRGIESIVVLRRGDSWADGIFNIFKLLWDKEGYSLFDVRYASESSDFSEYLEQAEIWVTNEIQSRGLEKVGVMCLSFDEIVDIIRNIEKYPNLYSLIWYGGDGTALSQKVLDEVSFQASKIRLFSLFSTSNESITFVDLYDRYFEKTSQPFGFYSANIYDICWIYALSILTCNSVDPDIIREILPDISKRYRGASGVCELDAAGDRLTCNYQIWGYGNEDDSVKAQVYGLYNNQDDSIVWTFDAEQNYSLLERNQLSREISAVRNEIPRLESDLVEFKQELIDNRKFAKLLTAYANTNGGSIYIGVTDDRQIMGILNPDQMQLHVVNIARSGCTPPLRPLFNVISVEGKMVLQCIISQSDQVHRSSDGKYYCRVGPSVNELSVEELSKLMRVRA